ncbi:MAG TPA: SpoIID/LytB domain-containing protein, partial [Polyangiaceae bacterium]|nr:SpoIID/LytB domain-containing protein [Polyangiaceae bacterium]
MWSRLLPVALLSLIVFACGPAEPGDESVGVLQEAVSAPLASAYCTAQVIGKGAKATEDDYLPHVIACENGGANLQALKAQAIAARSVLYYNMATSGSICDSQGCQVYSCGAAPQAKHYQAVKETAGMYLSYANTLTYGFYVAGDSGVKAPSCVDSGGSTTKYITYNAGKTGTSVKQTSLGWIGPAGNGQNRGCMGQWGARCLENSKGYDYKQILRFYYGADIQILTATGPCTKGCEPTHCEGSKIVSACGKGDCAAYGANCVNDSLGIRCVSVFCPAKGKTKACIDDAKIIDCNDGQPSPPGDCSAYAAYCSTAGVS